MVRNNNFPTPKTRFKACHKSKKAFSMVLVTILLLLFSVSTVLAAEKKFEFYDTGADDQSGAQIDNFLSQTFTIGTTGDNENFNISKIRMLVYRTGDPPGGVSNITIRSVNATGYPEIGTAILGNGTFNGSSITTNSNGEWIDVNLSTNATLNASQKYAIVWDTPESISPHYVLWKRDTTGAYTDGDMFLSQDDGVTWSNTSFSGDDFLFEVFGIVPLTTDFNISYDSFTFNEVSTEGNTETLITEIETFVSEVQNMFLVYNDTIHLATIKDQSGLNYNFTVTLNTPQVHANGNVTFHWVTTLLDGSVKNSSDNNQTILNLQIDDCSVFTNQIYNFTLRDEGDQSFLNGTIFKTEIEIDLDIFSLDSTVPIIEFNKSYNITNSVTVCLESDLSGGEQYRIDTVVRYKAENHTNEFYNILNGTLNSDAFFTNITLFDLASSDSTSFEVVFKDKDFIPVEGVLINVQRKYVGEGVFKTVEIPKTDKDGRTVVHLLAEDAIYTIIVSDESGVLATFENIIAICENPLTSDCIIPLTAVSSVTPIENFESYKGLSFNLDFNEAARTITLIYQVISGTIGTVDLNATKFDRLGNATVCSDTLTSASGTLTCIIPASFGNLTVIADVSFNGVVIKTQGFTIKPSADEIFGGSGKVMVLIMALTIPMMFISSGPGIIVGSIIGLSMGVWLNLLEGGSIFNSGSFIMWLIISGGILIWKIRQKVGG